MTVLTQFSRSYRRMSLTFCWPLYPDRYSFAKRDPPRERQTSKKYPHHGELLQVGKRKECKCYVLKTEYKEFNKCSLGSLQFFSFYCKYSNKWQIVERNFHAKNQPPYFWSIYESLYRIENVWLRWSAGEYFVLKWGRALENLDVFQRVY